MLKNELVLLLVFFSGISCNSQQTNEQPAEDNVVKLFLAGDVMTGRGIDQAFPVSVDPVLYEPYVKDAREYLLLAERESGEIETPFSFEYIWGEALEVWKEEDPDLKLVNLETSITTNDEPWPDKGINYRMHPENVEILSVAGIDHVSLANNHTLDWRRPGLLETITTLDAADIAFSGAGSDAEEAAEPSVFETEKGRVLVFSYGSPSSGIPPVWAATPEIPGVNLLGRLDDEKINNIRQQVERYADAGDLVVFSVHWGANWGYDLAEVQRDFAHKLLDETEVDVIFGHSSHHPLGIEVYNDKLIIYGAGDFINDYEGIGGHEEYRGELTMMYFPEFEVATGKLLSLKMIPMEIEKLQLQRAKNKDVKWLRKVLDREGKKLGTGVRREKGALWLEW